jgi:hypothetical protein
MPFSARLNFLPLTRIMKRADNETGLLPSCDKCAK